jgi:hypothetical protein
LTQALDLQALDLNEQLEAAGFKPGRTPGTFHAFDCRVQIEMDLEGAWVTVRLPNNRVVELRERRNTLRVAERT